MNKYFEDKILCDHIEKSIVDELKEYTIKNLKKFLDLKNIHDTYIVMNNAIQSDPINNILSRMINPICQDYTNFESLINEIYDELTEKSCKMINEYIRLINKKKCIIDNEYFEKNVCDIINIQIRKTLERI